MKIIEAKKEFMSKREAQLKKKLIALLKDDGKGHKHAKYAERLSDFIVKIVPIAGPSGDPEFTAAISFEDGTIYIGEGFLQDPSTFYQLNVLMRHELAHNLLMHEVRMMHKITDKYKDTGYSHIKWSSSLHDLLNIIEDFEISNKRYTSEDKQTVKNLWLNGHIISGLVTEDHRKWDTMSVEQMYENVNTEIDNIHKEILAAWATNTQPNINTIDNLNRKYISLYQYADTTALSQLPGDVNSFIKSNFFSKMPETLQSISKDIIDEIQDSTIYTKDELDILLDKIAKSSPTEEVNLTNPETGEIFVTLYTPEEKSLSNEIIKKVKEVFFMYDIWKEKVINALSDRTKYIDDDIKDILASLEGNK